MIVPRKLIAGYGAGETCAVCGQSIEPRQTIYEVVDEQSCRALAMHVACYSVWKLECMTPLSVERSAPTESL